MKFTFRTDYEPLRWVLKMNNSEGRLARRRFRVSVFGYKVVHHAGSNQKTSNALSLLSTPGVDNTPLVYCIPLLLVSNYVE